MVIIYILIYMSSKKTPSKIEGEVIEVFRSIFCKKIIMIFS